MKMKVVLRNSGTTLSKMESGFGGDHGGSVGKGGGVGGNGADGGDGGVAGPLPPMSGSGSPQSARPPIRGAGTALSCTSAAQPDSIRKSVTDSLAALENSGERVTDMGADSL